MSDTTPHGDPLEPKRSWPNNAEPMPSDLEARLDQIEDQDVGTGQSGNGPTNPPPRPAQDVPQPDTGAAKLQGEDEGATAEGGGQSLETAGGGGF
jgi:hypothetical protein